MCNFIQFCKINPLKDEKKKKKKKKKSKLFIPGKILYLIMDLFYEYTM